MIIKIMLAVVNALMIAVSFKEMIYYNNKGDIETGILLAVLFMSISISITVYYCYMIQNKKERDLQEQLKRQAEQLKKAEAKTIKTSEPKQDPTDLDFYDKLQMLQDVHSNMTASGLSEADRWSAFNDMYDKLN